jgi:hypothetical protein
MPQYNIENYIPQLKNENNLWPDNLQNFRQSWKSYKMKQKQNFWHRNLPENIKELIKLQP